MLLFHVFLLLLQGFLAVEVHLVQVFAVLDLEVRNLHFVLVLLQLHLVLQLEVLAVQD